MEKVQLGAISAASLAIASKGIGDLQLGTLGQIHIMGDGGSILLLRVGGRAVLTLVVEQGVEIPSILAEARKTASRLAPVFLAALSALVRVMTHQAAGGPAEAWPFLLFGLAAWPLGWWAAGPAVGRAPLGLGPPGLALALAAGAHLALTVQHARTDRGTDALYPWFSAG
jgi:hypothetical protein